MQRGMSRAQLAPQWREPRRACHFCLLPKEILEMYVFNWFDVDMLLILLFTLSVTKHCSSHGCDLVQFQHVHRLHRTILRLHCCVSSVSLAFERDEAICTVLRKEVVSTISRCIHIMCPQCYIHGPIAYVTLALDAFRLQLWMHTSRMYMRTYGGSLPICMASVAS